MIRLHIGDVRAVLAEMEPESVDLVATSWPFLALRSYLPADHPDKALEIGSEATPGDFLDTLLDVTEGFARVLAPHGSICTELGDTMAGSGGAGGDYGDQGLRAGQSKFLGSSGRRNRPTDLAGLLAPTKRPGPEARDHMAGWPLDKSMCVIPHLYAASLAYGRNLLNPERVTDPWRVRNIVAWVRANPPVGSLGGGTPEEGTGDARFRAATSYLTIACKGRARWFDLDAVRTAHKEAGHVQKPRPNRNPSSGWTEEPTSGILNPAGAPPLDWWLVNPKGYSGAHFAVWPLELLTRPIQAMCPRRVCRTCGVPSRRITASERIRLHDGMVDPPRVAPSRDDADGTTGAGVRTGMGANVATLGWTTCGCPGTEEGSMWTPAWREALQALRAAQKAVRGTKQGTPEREAAQAEARACAEAVGKLWRGRNDGYHAGAGWRPGVVLDPFMGSGTTAVAASGLSRDVIGIDIDERNIALLEDRLGPLMASSVEIVRLAACH